MKYIESHRKIICIVTTGLAYGGAETQLVSLAIMLKQRGWSVSVVSMLSPTAFIDELYSHGIPIYDLNMSRGVPDIRALFRFVKILRELKPQFVHAHMVHANLLARVARIFVRIPVLVCTAHSINEGGRAREIAYRATDFLSDMTSQVSSAGLSRYVREHVVPADKIRFIPNGVSLSRFSLRHDERCRLRCALGVDDAFVWLSVGRFENPKDQLTLIKAFSLVKNCRKAVLLLVGDGSQRGWSEDCVRDLGLEHRVMFLGIRNDVSELMSASDAFVLSSRWEGMPLVLLEAAAVGLPVVASDVGGVPEVVVNGVSGFLVPPSQPEALSIEMSKLMSMSSNELEIMGQAGSQYVGNCFSLDSVTSQWEDLYLELLTLKERK